MRFIVASVALAMSFCFFGNGFTTASAEDVGVLLDDVSYGQVAQRSANQHKAMRLGLATTRVDQQLRPAPVSSSPRRADLRPKRMPATQPAGSQASLKAPVASSPRQVEPQPFDAPTAIAELARSSGSVNANSVGWLKNRLNPDSACDGGCDSCEPACEPACESCVVLPPNSCGCEGCGRGGLKSCLAKHRKQEEVKVCLPRREVNLPQSTFHQYFRSNRCYTNIWDGYSKECGDSHKHIHGTCDCHVKKQRKSCLAGRCGGGCGEVLAPAMPCGPVGCDGCGDSGCDCGH